MQHRFTLQTEALSACVEDGRGAACSRRVAQVQLWTLGNMRAECNRARCSVERDTAVSQQTLAEYATAPCSSTVQVAMMLLLYLVCLQEFASAGGGMRGSFTSALNSPRSGSGFATPTAAAGHNAALAAAAMLSPGSFFSSSLQLPAAASRVGSLSLGGLPPRSGAATPSAASVVSGAFLPGPATPKRDMSAARLSELVHHPMAAATAAAGATMAEQERESFSQLAAEASTAGTTAVPTANGTPGEALSAALSVSATPVGSMGATVSPNATAAELQSSESLGPYAAAGSFARGLGGLSVAVSGSAAGGGLISRYSSTEMLAAASPRFAAASPRYAGESTDG